MKYNKSQMNSYMTIYRQRKREECKLRLGNKCAKCGATENLEFDHIDPTTKTNSKSAIANLITANKEKLNQELIKCQLLCNDCHREKNKIDCGVIHRKPIKHGTISGYQHYKCRCTLCREAYANWRKNRKSRNRT